MVLVRIPASSANLGPGFDCLGVALNLYNYVAIKECSDSLRISLAGSYSEGFPVDESNLVYSSAKLLWQKVGFEPSGIAMHLVNNIPPAKGLGSSSAAIIGGLYAANLFAGSPLTKEEILDLATELEGHPDNAAPTLFGGVTLAIRQPSGECIFRSLGQMNGLKLVVAIPNMILPTEYARNLLPMKVSMADAVWNLGRTGLLVTSLLTQDYTLLKAAMQDNLHEKYRSHVIPGMPSALSAAKEAGALGAVLSGAGPSLISFVPQNADEIKVGKAMQDAFANAGVNCEIRNLCSDASGAVELDPSALDLTKLGSDVLAC